MGILKTGAIVEPLFSAFGEDALYARMHDSGAVAIITERRHLGKVRRVRERLPELKTVIVIDHEEDGKPLREGEHAYTMGEHRVERFAIARTYAESPSVLHYTSGTTGAPKGAMHVHSSIFAQYLTSKIVLDLRDDDIYWCTADPGWVTGTSYGIIGPWALGATQIVVNAGFSSDRWYETIEKHKVTVWYTAPTAIRMLMKDGLEPVRRHDLSTLRHMCSVGEPLNPEAVRWGREAIGHDIHVLADGDGVDRRDQSARHAGEAGEHGPPVPRARGGGDRREDGGADHGGGSCGPHRRASALAQHDAGLLEQLRHLLQEVPQRLVRLRRPREPRQGGLLLVLRA
jgi:acetyl-CoA synthetase